MESNEKKLNRYVYTPILNPCLIFLIDHQKRFPINADGSFQSRSAVNAFCMSPLTLLRKLGYAFPSQSFFLISRQYLHVDTPPRCQPGNTDVNGCSDLKGRLTDRAWKRMSLLSAVLP